MAKRILAVDDNSVILEVYIQLLSAEGYEVSVAKDGSEALKVLETWQPDLVVLDIGMPNLPGWQLLEIMRSRVEWHDIPAIMVTALLEPPPVEKESYPEYNCYVTKKVTGNELVALVAQNLEDTVATPVESPPNTGQRACP